MMRSTHHPSRPAGQQSASRRKRRWPRRHPVWTALFVAVVIVVGLRAALPFALAWAIEREAPRFLTGSVDVGDIDLELVRGAVTVKDLSAFGPPSDPASGPGDRWFHVEQARVQIAWRPLADHTCSGSATSCW